MVTSTSAASSYYVPASCKLPLRSIFNSMYIYIILGGGGGGGGPTQKNTNAPLKFQIRIRNFSYFLQIVVKIIIRRGEDSTFSLLISIYCCQNIYIRCETSYNIHKGIKIILLFLLFLDIFSPILGQKFRFSKNFPNREQMGLQLSNAIITVQSVQWMFFS